MPISTKLTKALGISHPLIQGGMHYVGYAPLAAAVSNAGAIGCITALTFPSPESLQAEIKKCKELTKKPFGVNLTLLPMLQPSAGTAREQRDCDTIWRLRDVACWRCCEGGDGEQQLLRYSCWWHERGHKPRP